MAVATFLDTSLALFLFSAFKVFNFKLRVAIVVFCRVIVLSYFLSDLNTTDCNSENSQWTDINSYLCDSLMLVA